MFQEFRRPTVVNSLLMFVLFFPTLVLGSSPGDKRTILTSGEKVQTIYYQLGQSTVLYFGMRPDTVICGNKNYFNIEKIKEGLTIQPLSNFATNLTVLTGEKRFLFFLTPTRGSHPDTFVDVRWVPGIESRIVATNTQTTEVVRALNQKLRLYSIEVRLKREIHIEQARRSIVEIEIKNLTKGILKTSEIEILAVNGGRPVAHQVSVFEEENLQPQAHTLGRLIITGSDFKNVIFVTSYHGQSAKIQIKGGTH